MGIFEAIIIGMFVFVGGTFVGSEGQKMKQEIEKPFPEDGPVLSPTPVNWTPAEHRNVMLQCRAVCGEGRVKSYDTLTSNCKCYPMSKIDGGS